MAAFKQPLVICGLFRNISATGSFLVYGSFWEHTFRPHEPLLLMWPALAQHKRGQSLVPLVRVLAQSFHIGDD